MPSRVFIGVGAWVLGAASATAGSLYAIAQLGQGLVEQHTAQVSVAMVNAELHHDAVPTPSTAAVTQPSPTASHQVSHTPAKPRSGGSHHATPPVAPNPKWLSSRGGTTIAICGSAGAKLLHNSPASGFEVDQARTVLGPATVASVAFTNSWIGLGVVVNVTCDNGVPVEKNVSQFPIKRRDE